MPVLEKVRILKNPAFVGVLSENNFMGIDNFHLIIAG